MATESPNTGFARAVALLPADPEGIIEVRKRRPIKAGFDAILIAGRLEVLQDDPQGVYYRIRDAESLPIR